jgi:CoA:oxalate CoA-transferase
VRNGHAYLGAPYGIYKTADSWIALAMGSVTQLGTILSCEALQAFTDPKTWFTQRDEIKGVLRDHLATKDIGWCLTRLREADYWCAEVLSWSRLREEEAYKVLGWEQTVTLSGGSKVKTSRCPIRIDGERFYSETGSPRIGQHNAEIQAEFGL